MNPTCKHCGEKLHYFASDKWGHKFCNAECQKKYKRDLATDYRSIQVLEVQEIAEHAIKRALKAEALVRELVEALEKSLDNVAWELAEQEHLLNLAKEVLGDEN